MKTWEPNKTDFYEAIRILRKIDSITTWSNHDIELIAKALEKRTKKNLKKKQSSKKNDEK